MGKPIFLGLLLVLATAIAMTSSLVYPPPAMQPAVGKIPAAMSKDNDSSSSSSSSSSSEESSSDDDDDKSDESSKSMDDQERMLCNVIARATHDLHVYQSKSADEITTYLDTDCENLENQELIEQCREILAQHGAKIYEHVVNGMKMSTVCKKIEESNEIDLDDEETAQCPQGGKDKCQCCKSHVEKRKLRLRFIVKQIAKKRMYMCKRSPHPQRCRQWIQRKERWELKKIAKICPYMVCKHLGYCETVSEDNAASKLLMEPKIGTVIGSPSLSVGLLDQQLEAHLTNDVCSKFEQLQPLCIHLAASIDGRHYAKLYMAVLDNDTKWIDNDLRKQAQSAQAGANADLCGACKNVIQSAKDFFLQNVETVRNALDSTCEQCPAKEKCKAFFDKRLDMINAYLNQLKPDAFCSAVHICSLSSSVVLSFNNGGEDCAICTQHLQPRKDAAIQAVKRLSDYFTDRCAEWDMPDCQQFFSEVLVEVSSYINEFDVKGACLTMGFCGQNAAHDIGDYENAFVDEISKNVCSTLGPFETLCQQVVQGNSKQVQTVSINAIDINDFLQPCDEENAVAATTDQCSKDKDKCQCCIAHVIQKKKCLKKRVAKYVWHMLQLCKRCPAREKCVHYWEEKKAFWDAKIDKICPKKACIRMGYCKKVETSSMCDYMGPFKQICEQTRHSVGQLLGEGHEQPAIVVADPVPVPSKDEQEKQPIANKP